MRTVGSTGIAIAALLTVLPSATCLGQTVGDDNARAGIASAPAENQSVTPGRVDMRTGLFGYSIKDLSIGADGEVGLALIRSLNVNVVGHLNPFGNFTHNWDIMLTEQRIDLGQGDYNTQSGPDYRIRIHFGGRSETFDGNAAYATFEQLSKREHATLTYSGNRSSASVVYTYQATDGTQVVFRPLGNGDCSNILRCAYASQIISPDGMKYTLEYENPTPGTANTTRLRSVTNSRGYALLLEYGQYFAAWHHINKACVINLAVAPKPSNNVCPSGAPMSKTYSYTAFESSEWLGSVTNVLGSTESFTYGRSGASLVMNFFKPGISTAWLTNTSYQRTLNNGDVHDVVTSQVFGDGRSYSYIYNETPEMWGQVQEIAGGRYQDAAGNWSYVTYDAIPRPQSFNPPRVNSGGYPYVNYGDVYYQITPEPSSVIDALGRETKAGFCDPYVWNNLPSSENQRCLVTMRQWTEDPEGNRTEFTYDGYSTRNITQVRRKAKPPAAASADLVTEAHFDCTYAVLCAKPTWTEDARDNRTDYTYSSVHGGVLTETAPADANGIRPVRRYTYAQRYAWLSNGAGGYVQASDPVWVLTEMRICTTSATVSNACAGGSADEVVTTFDYGPNSGPNNLLLRGTVVDSGGLALRTCYSYDQLGNKISETKPRALLTSCP